MAIRSSLVAQEEGKHMIYVVVVSFCEYSLWFPSHCSWSRERTAKPDGHSATSSVLQYTQSVAQLIRNQIPRH